MDMPDIISVKQLAASRVSIDLAIDARLDVFEGHFPDLPVVAGVVQIHWVLQLASRYLRPLSPLVIAHMEAIKFQRLLTPPVEVLLELELAADKLLFVYSSAAGRHASGRIALLP